VDILDVVDRNRSDLDKAVKELVRAANRGGGEDNITAVAFRIDAAPDETAANAEDTVTMPAVTDEPAEPDEETREYADAEAEPPPAESAGPATAIDQKRVGIVLSSLVLFLVLTAVLVWGLAR
jgi:hypothetical protein